MPSIRCEALVFDSWLVQEISKNRQGDTIAATTTPVTGTSAIVFGPVPRQTDVAVTAYGGQMYVTKGAGAIVATAANSKWLKPDDVLPLRLDPGESIAAVAVNLT